MKKILSIAIVIAVAIGGCKKDNSTPTPGNNNNNGGGGNTTSVNDVKLGITQISTQVMSLNSGSYYAVFEHANGTIYFGNVSNAGVVPYFSKYDIASNTFTTGLDTTEELCACGYGSAMVSDGTDVYYIANEGEKFSAKDNKWVPVNFPAAVQTNHGESAPVYLNKRIYYVGGRTPSTVVKYYDIATNTWYNAADYPYAASQAAGIAVNGNIYIMGGDNNGVRMAMYTPTSNSWQEKGKLPFKGNFRVRGHHLAVLNKYIFVSMQDSIHVYDTEVDKWSANPIAVPFTVDYQHVNIFSWNGKIYITNRNAAGAFQLYEAKLN